MKKVKVLADQGQALVEFALAIPILLILFFGCLELVHLALAHVIVKDAVYEAGRQAKIDNNQSYQAQIIASRLGDKISSGRTKFIIETNQDNKLQYYSVIHYKEPLMPILPKKEVKHTVPAMLFHTGN